MVICCHNGASRLPRTLAHLAAQKVDPQLRWEVILVDNASTDRTAEVARSSWPQHPPAPLRVVSEPRLGLSFARERGFAEASYEVVGFVDDDNWVAEDWVSIVSEVMAANPDVGALGGVIEALGEIELPPWFETWKCYYATISEPWAEVLIHLSGAGLCVRKLAWLNLVRDGFRFHLSGRRGKALSGAEDLELTHALYLAGWRLHFEPRLKLKHFMPATRLQWRYARRLLRACYASNVALEAYFRGAEADNLRFNLRKTWLWHSLGITREILSRPTSLLLWLFAQEEGNSEVMDIEIHLGRLKGFLTLRSRYNAIKREVHRAAWRNRRSPQRADLGTTIPPPLTLPARNS